MRAFDGYPGPGVDEEDTGDEQETLPPDFKFASYRIGRTLGVGAFGAVYEAFREPLNKRVALKVLHPQLASNQDAVARFIREAELVAQIEHPNIVAVLDVGIERGVPFLAMEFLDGETLTARLTRGGMSVPAALDIVLPVVAAVAVVHERGVVHRDLKPDNIYLSRKVTGAVVPVLLDFGIAKVQETRFSMTRTNSLMGTPFYMSPEQARQARNVDARSDQWTLAVILYECVAGRRAFAGGGLLEILMAIATQPIEPLSSVVEGLPPGFEAALGRALERDPAGRYPTTRELGVALLPFATPVTRALWAEALGRVSAIPAAPLMLSKPSQTPSVNRAMAALLSMQGAAVATAPPPPPQAPDEPPPEARTEHAAPKARPERPRFVSIAVAVPVLVVAMVAGGLVVRSVMGDNAPAPPETYALVVRVDPPVAQIELDGTPVGTGVLLRALPDDHALHTLRVSAPGYEPRTSTFRDAVPEQNIVLLAVRSVARPVDAAVEAGAAATPPDPTAPPDSSAGHGERRRGRRHHGERGD
jgi:serine/threonine protein kinase